MNGRTCASPRWGPLPAPVRSAYWVEVMDKDVNRIEDEAKEAALRAELAKFRESVFGGAPAAPNWMSL
jgi:hypothetical protein